MVDSIQPTKAVKERYRRASVNWGQVAVHPTDLFTVYRELIEARLPSIKTPEGTPGSRTNSLACIVKGVQGLQSNGYKPREIAAILASIPCEGKL